MTQYATFFRSQILQHPKEREREFYDFLYQMSTSPTPQIYKQFNHFCKRYLKTITPLLIPSYAIDFILTFLPSIPNHLLKVLLLFTTVPTARLRLLYLRLPSLLLPTSTIHLQIINNLLSPSSTFSLRKILSATRSSDAFSPNLMRCCASWIFPLQPTSESTLSSCYDCWRYASLTGRRVLVPHIIHNTPSTVASVHAPQLIKRLYGAAEERDVDAIKDIINALGSTDGLVKLRDRLVVETLKLVLVEMINEEDVVELCIQAIKLCCVDYHALLAIFNENLITIFLKVLRLYKDNSNIIFDVLDIMFMLSQNDALVNLLLKTDVVIDIDDHSNYNEQDSQNSNDKISDDVDESNSSTNERKNEKQTTILEEILKVPRKTTTIKILILQIVYQILLFSSISIPNITELLDDCFDESFNEFTLRIEALLIQRKSLECSSQMKNKVISILESNSENDNIIEAALFFLQTTQIDITDIQSIINKYDGHINYLIHSIVKSLQNQPIVIPSFEELLMPTISITDSTIFLILSNYASIANVMITGSSPSKFENQLELIISKFPIELFARSDISPSQQYIAASHYIYFLLNVLKLDENSKLTPLCYEKLCTLLQTTEFCELWYEHDGCNLFMLAFPQHHTLTLLHHLLKHYHINKDLCTNHDLVSHLIKLLVDEKNITEVVRCLLQLQHILTPDERNTIHSTIVTYCTNVISQINTQTSNDNSLQNNSYNNQFIVMYRFLNEVGLSSAIPCKLSFIKKTLTLFETNLNAKAKRWILEFFATSYSSNSQSISRLITHKTISKVLQNEHDNHLFNAAIRLSAIIAKNQRASLIQPHVYAIEHKEQLQQSKLHLKSIKDILKVRIVMVAAGNISDDVFLQTSRQIEHYEKDFNRQMEQAEVQSLSKYYRASYSLFASTLSTFISPQLIFAIVDCEGRSDETISNEIQSFHDIVQSKYPEAISHLALLLNLSTESKLFTSALPQDLKSILFVLDSLTPTSINSIHAHSQTCIASFTESHPPPPHYNPLFPKKTAPLTYYLAGLSALYRTEYDVSYQCFSDAQKAFRTPTTYNQKLFNQAAIGAAASILQDPAKKNLASSIKDVDDIIRDAVKYNDNNAVESYYSKELLCCLAQQTLQSDSKKTQEIIREISARRSHIKSTLDVVSALEFDSILKQLELHHHRQHILHEVSSCQTPHKSFIVYAVDQLADLLSVSDLTLLDKEYTTPPTRPHVITQIKSQWSTLRAHVLIRKVLLREVYDEEMALILIRLLAYFNNEVSANDQVECISRLDLISKALGAPVVIKPALPTLPFIDSISLSPQSKNDIIHSRVSKKSIFLVDPSKQHDDVTVWASRETSYITIQITNPLHVSLEVDNITLWSGGVSVEPHFKCISIDPHSTRTIDFAVTPKHAGELIIYGIQYDCCSLHFMGVPTPHRSLMINNNFTSCMNITVVSCVPRLHPTPGTYLSEAITLFPGQTNESVVCLRNDGERAVNEISFHIKDDDPTKLTDVQITKDLKQILPILPNSTVELPLAISARGGLSKVSLEIKYATSSKAKFGRIFSMDINVIVSVGLLIDKWQIIPIEDILLVSCVKKINCCCKKKPSCVLTSKNAAKWINDVLLISWTSSSGCDGVISVAESETVVIDANDD
ncbi:Trafficking protein particle complex subunit 11 domain-containing protein [Entamoeba marina]